MEFSILFTKNIYLFGQSVEIFVQFNAPTEEPVRLNQFSSCSRKGCSPNTILSKKIIPAGRCRWTHSHCQDWSLCGAWIAEQQSAPGLPSYSQI